MLPPFFSRWLLRALLVTSGIIVLVFAILGVYAVFTPHAVAVDEIKFHVNTFLPITSNAGTKTRAENLLCIPHTPATKVNPHLIIISLHSSQNKQILLTCWQLSMPLKEQCSVSLLSMMTSLFDLPNSVTVWLCIFAFINLLLLLWIYLQLNSAIKQVEQLQTELQQFEQHFALYLNEHEQQTQEQQALVQEVSHDMRTRLHAVQLLAMGVEQNATPSLLPQINRLGVALNQLQQFVQQFLQFSRTHQVQAQTELQPMQLQDLLQEMELQFEDIALESKIELKVRVCDIWLESDRQLLERIVANLLANAIKFARHKVLLSARIRQQAIWIEVRDDGLGIALDEQAAIFSPFYRSKTANRTPGIGLGLAIVQRLLNSLQYKIELISHPGRGSLMRVIISR